MSVCGFNSLAKSEYSNLFIASAFPNNSFSGKTSLRVKKSYLLTFADDKAEILTFALLDFVIDFLTNTIFYNKFLLNLNGLSEDTVALFTKN